MGATFVTLSLSLGVVYATRPDAAAAVTLIPFWVWLPPLAGLGFFSAWPSRRGIAGAACLCTGLWCLLAEEPWALLPNFREPGSTRIVSLNWGGAKDSPIPSLTALKPDLLLIQESPRIETLQKLTEKLGQTGHYSVLRGPEASLIARGELELLEVGSFYLRGRWRGLEVVSLRLRPPVLRFDIWRGDCLRDQTLATRERRHQLESVLEKATGQVLVGGDFNAPAGDGALSPLQDSHLDLFAKLGSGWGNTAPAYLPLHRIDQIWFPRTAPRLNGRCWTTAVEGSDHRAVVADVEFEPAP